MSSTKSIPLTKVEVMQLLNLIEANPVVFSKATNARNNQLKDAAWTKITRQFNSTVESCPRKPEQLRLKWENLKKTARKRSANMRINNQTTGGGKPDYISQDDTLDKVAAILGPTCGGKVKRISAADDLKASIIAKNLAIARHYDAKKKQDEEIAALKKIKLQLEIEELKNNRPN